MVNDVTTLATTVWTMTGMDVSILAARKLAVNARCPIQSNEAFVVRVREAVVGLGGSATIKEPRMSEGVALAFNVSNGLRAGVGEDASVGMESVCTTRERFTWDSFSFDYSWYLRYSTLISGYQWMIWALFPNPSCSIEDLSSSINFSDQFWGEKWGVVPPSTYEYLLSSSEPHFYLGLFNDAT